METILADLVAAVVDPGLHEKALLAVGAKSSIFQSLQDCIDVGEIVLIVVDSSNQDVVKDTVRVWNPLQQLIH